jgi:hypothetical protein
MRGSTFSAVSSELFEGLIPYVDAGEETGFGDAEEEACRDQAASIVAEAHLRV